MPLLLLTIIQGRPQTIPFSLAKVMSNDRAGPCGIEFWKDCSGRTVSERLVVALTWNLSGGEIIDECEASSISDSGILFDVGLDCKGVKSDAFRFGLN
jgi:hypothetical protein